MKKDQLFKLLALKTEILMTSFWCLPPVIVKVAEDPETTLTVQ